MSLEFQTIIDPDWIEFKFGGRRRIAFGRLPRAARPLAISENGKHQL